jgi:glycosyltransferase involved in cell wall biosynthesis
MYQYGPSLEQSGVEITWSPLFSDEYVRKIYTRASRTQEVLDAYRRRALALRGASRFDLLWIEKELFPGLPAWAERSLQRLRVPLIVDYDDAVFHNYDAHRLATVRRLLGGKIDEVMRRAQLVVAGNDYLADRARAAGAARVELLPTVVDLDAYAVTDPPAGAPFTIGWIGTPVTAPYLCAVAPALAAICGSGGARLVAVGSGPIELDGVATEVRPWTEETQAAEVAGFDAGIMPLPDERWERGKCGYKLIQYMACGRPVVASPVGVNCRIVKHGVNGFLASTPAEWERALATLRDDPARRHEMGRAARETVEREYSLQRTAPRLAELLKEVGRAAILRP